MSHFIQLFRMLDTAKPAHDYQKLHWMHEKSGDGTVLKIHTGPDDAEAIFAFDKDGKLNTVEVNECLAHWSEPNAFRWSGAANAGPNRVSRATERLSVSGKRFRLSSRDVAASYTFTLPVLTAQLVRVYYPRRYRNEPVR